MKNKVKDGDIIEIPLTRYGYGSIYCKYSNLRHIYRESDYQDLLRVYDHFVDSPDIGGVDFDSMDLLMNPLVVNGVIVGIMKLGWKIVGNVPLKVEERMLPDVKIGLPITATNESEVTKWWILKDAGDSSKYYPATESDIRSLEHAGAIDAEYIPFRISLELFRRAGKDIADEFELDFVERDIYWKANTR